jgi:transcriptional regulator with XRE-family HTH domain
MASESPSSIVAARIRTVRRKRELTVPDLAKRCADAGSPGLTEAALYNLEGRRTGKRPPRPVTVDELLALAKVLQVAPVHLLVPPNAGEEPYRVTSEVTAPAEQVREWIRGYGLLPGDSDQEYLTEVPPDDFEEMAGVLFPLRPWQRAARQARAEHGEGES